MLCHPGLGHPACRHAAFLWCGTLAQDTVCCLQAVGRLMPWEGQSLDPSETLALRLSNTAVLASTPASSALATVTAQGSMASGRSPAAAHMLQCQCPGRLLGTADTSACQARNTTFTSPTCSMLANGSSMDACRRFVDHAGARHMTTPCSGWRPSLPNSAGVPCAEYQPDGRRPGWNSSAKAASNDVALSLSDANRQESLQEMRQRFMSRLQQVGGEWAVDKREAAWRVSRPCTAFSQGAGLLPAARVLVVLTCSFPGSGGLYTISETELQCCM